MQEINCTRVVGCLRKGFWSQPAAKAPMGSHNCCQRTTRLLSPDKDLVKPSERKCHSRSGRKKNPKHPNSWVSWLLLGPGREDGKPGTGCYGMFREEGRAAGM